MNIARTAPGQFDFQDHCCLLLLIQAGFPSEFSCHVEPQGGEDFEFRSAITNKALIEVQVKGSREAVTILDLAECLLHFPERESASPLLERLQHDPDRRAVLLFSGRANDAVAPLLKSFPFNVDAQKSERPSMTTRKGLLESLKQSCAAMRDDTQLSAARKSHAEQLVAGINQSQAADILSQISVYERCEHAKVKEDCIDRLVTCEAVPRHAAEATLAKAQDVINAHRQTGEDVSTGILQAIRQHSTQSLRPVDYVPRVFEREWCSQLLRDRVLLLAGPPRVGKTYVGRSISASLAAEGFETGFFTQAGQAERYLNAPTDGRRLAFLDDPLGQLDASPEAATAYEAIVRLARSPRADRMLVVSQMTAPLLAIAGSATAQEITTGGIAWRVVPRLQIYEAQSIWDAAVHESNVPEDLGTFVRAALVAGDLDLEPGCLVRLAREASRYTGALETRAITQFASQDAEDLARLIDRDQEAPLLRALAIATDPESPVAMVDLASALAGRPSEHPSRDENAGNSVMVFGLEPKDKAAPECPSYTAPPTLPSEVRSRLDKLERRSWIIAEPDPQFRHATYRAAAQFLVDGQTSLARENLDGILNAALFCPTPATTRAVARNLDWLFHRVQGNAEAEAIVFGAAKNGLSSRFPATRDLCFSFLARHADAKEMKVSLEEISHRILRFDLADVYWKDGEPFLPSGDDELGFRHLSRQFEETALESIEATLSQLADPSQPLPITEDAARAAQYLRLVDTNADPTQISRLLSYEEAIIRAEAAKIWLKEDRSDQTGIVERLFTDQHPRNARAILEAALDSWEGYGEAFQRQLCAELAVLAKSPACALPLLLKLEVMDRGETPVSELPWALFEAIMPTILRTLPIGAPINDARLYTIADASLSHLTKDGVFELLSAMLCRVEADLHRGRLPSDYDFGVIALSLKSTLLVPGARTELIQRILALESTGARLTVAAEVAVSWDRIPESDQRIIADWIKFDAPDRDWLAAAVLTSNNRPQPLVRAFLDAKAADEIASNEVPDGLSAELMTACLQLYIGVPQPLYWLGKHGGAAELWEPEVCRVAADPSHPLRDSAWRYLWTRSNWQTLSECVAKAIDHDADQTFALLLDIKLERTGEFGPAVWAALFANCPTDAHQERWVISIADCLAGCVDSFSDLSAWLPREIALAVAEHFPADIQVLNTVYDLTSTSGDVPVASDMLDVLLDSIRELVGQHGVRLHWTLADVQRVMDRNEQETLAVYEKIEAERRLLLANARQSRDRVVASEADLAGWVGIR